jgi:hypothetical protein
MNPDSKFFDHEIGGKSESSVGQEATGCKNCINKNRMGTITLNRIISLPNYIFNFFLK